MSKSFAGNTGCLEQFFVRLPGKGEHLVSSGQHLHSGGVRNAQTFGTLAKDVSMAVVSSGTLVYPQIALCATLRFLAGGPYLDIGFAYEIASKNVTTLVWRVLEVLDSTLDNIPLPMASHDELAVIEKRFRDLSQGCIAGCVAAIDGVAFKTRVPFKAEVRGRNVLTYRNRKGYPAIVVIAACDAQRRFSFTSARNPGSAHDASAFAMSDLGKALTSGKLPAQFHVAGDEAFVASNSLLTPWPGRELPRDKDAFKFFHSRQRQAIECAFEILVQRWGILWRSLRVALKRWSKIVVVCCKLHNLCLTESVPEVNVVDFDRDTDPIENGLRNKNAQQVALVAKCLAITVLQREDRGPEVVPLCIACTNAAAALWACKASKLLAATNTSFREEHSTEGSLFFMEQAHGDSGFGRRV